MTMDIRKRLIATFAYIPETGEFTRLVEVQWNAKAGSLTGHRDNQGYIRVGFEGGYVLGHRLAWLLMTGDWPPCGIDHRNLDKGDNRWVNLRLATGTENNANWASRGPFPKGVTRLPSGRFQAAIKKQGQSYYLGAFDTVEEAHAAYRGAAKVLFGDFARAA